MCLMQSRRTMHPTCNYTLSVLMHFSVKLRPFQVSVRSVKKSDEELIQNNTDARKMHIFDRYLMILPDVLLVMQTCRYGILAAMIMIVLCSVIGQRQVHI